MMTAKAAGAENFQNILYVCRFVCVCVHTWAQHKLPTPSVPNVGFWGLSERSITEGVTRLEELEAISGNGIDLIQKFSTRFGGRDERSSD